MKKATPTIIDKLAEVLNEIVESTPQNRLTIANTMMLRCARFTGDASAKLAPDILTQPCKIGDEPIQVSLLGVINTALHRAGNEDRLVAVCDDGLEDEFAKGRLIRFETRKSQGFQVYR